MYSSPFFLAFHLYLSLLFLPSLPPVTVCLSLHLSNSHIKVQHHYFRVNHFDVDQPRVQFDNGGCCRVASHFIIPHLSCEVWMALCFMETPSSRLAFSSSLADHLHLVLFLDDGDYFDMRFLFFPLQSQKCVLPTIGGN